MFGKKKNTYPDVGKKTFIYI